MSRKEPDKVVRSTGRRFGKNLRAMDAAHREAESGKHVHVVRPITGKPGKTEEVCLNKQCFGMKGS